VEVTLSFTLDYERDLATMPDEWRKLGAEILAAQAVCRGLGMDGPLVITGGSKLTARLVQVDAKASRRIAGPRRKKGKSR
jgi:hypothetical protein